MSETAATDEVYQRNAIEGFIEETTTYYIICEKCYGCHDLSAGYTGRMLFTEGWRVIEGAGRGLAYCPKCAQEAEGQQ